MAEYSEALDNEKHKTINKRLDKMEDIISVHGDKIEILENNKAATEIQILNLIKEMQSLVSTIKWGVGIFGGIATLTVAIIGLVLR